MPKRSLPGTREFDRLNLAVEKVLERTGEGARHHTDDAPLATLAAALRDLPREKFKASLKKNLERSASMATISEPISAIQTVAMPRLTYKHTAAAIDFYTKAFGAKELFRFEVGGSIPHVEVKIGESVLSLSDEWPDGGRFSAETLGHSPVQVSLRVDDVDSFAERAIAAGLKVVIPIRDQFYGRREGTFVDPFGYTWNIGTVTEEMPVEEMYRRFHAMTPPQQEPSVPPVPKGFRMLTPYVVAQNADGLIDFLKQTFAVEVTHSSVGPAGGRHAELRVGDSMMMIGGGGPGLKFTGQPYPGAFHVYVKDADAAYDRAVKAGGETIQPPTDQPYGERSSSIKDPAGNFWYIATRSEGNYKWGDVTDVQPYLHPLRAEPMIQFLKLAFGAEETGRYATPQGVVQHATVKMGNSYLEMGEAHDQYAAMQSMFYLYVPDCDAMYRRALAAGATSIMEPKDHPYGDRSGAVKDVFGNEWWIATHVKDVP